MDLVERQLERLDSEVDALTAEIDAAWGASFRATQPQQKTELTQRYEALRKDMKCRLSQRHDLQLMLCSSGKHTA